MPLELTWEDESISRKLGVPHIPDAPQPGRAQPFHFEFMRPLGFGNPVYSMAFSACGRWLFTGASTGIIKVWEVVRWAEVARLRGVRDEAVDDILLSPSQQWLVSIQPSGLSIFHCRPPWKLEQRVAASSVSMTALPDPTSQPVWRVAAFAPALEANTSKPADTQFAAMSSTHLLVMDCAQGLGARPRRTHSYSSASIACALVYTACGSWIICGYEDGRIEIWDAFQLAITKAVRAHVGTIECLTSTLLCMDCTPHLVSAGSDGRIKLWPSTTWSAEQIVIDKFAGAPGVRACGFTADGAALVSIAREVCIWATAIDGKRHLSLSLHQRLEAAVSAQGLCVASLCKISQVLAVGSIDGAVGIWQRRAGQPPKPKLAEPVVTSKEEPKLVPYRPMTPVRAKPMRKVSAVGLPEQECKATKALPTKTWSLSTSLARPASSPGEKRRCTSAAAQRLVGNECAVPPTASLPIAPRTLAWQAATGNDQPMQRNKSSPELVRSSFADVGRWSPKRFEFEAVFGRTIPARAF